MASKDPEILDYRNANGHGWKFYKYNGILRQLREGNTPEEDLKMILKYQNTELRDDDIMIIAYPKCGTHWLWEIINMVVSGTADYHPQKKEVAMLGMPMFEKADELPSPRVLNTHLRGPLLPKTYLDKKIKTIHIMRNPKDVSVSFYHHFNGFMPPKGFEGSYSEFADLFLEGKMSCGSYFEFISHWQKLGRDNPDLPLLTIFYEDLKRKPEEIIKTLAKFLGYPIDDDLCTKIVEACSFTKLKGADKDVKEGLEDKGNPSMWKDDHGGMYRKGEIGDWKNWLTVAQNEKFNDVIKKEMKDTGITFVYE